MIWYLDSTPLQKNQECAVPLGVQGEDNAKVYTADVSDWLAAYPLGIIVLVLQAPDGSAPYMANTSTDAETGKVSWTVTAYDTAIVGYGKGELRLIASDAVVKSYAFRTYTKPSVLMCVSTPPAPVPEWATDILETAEGVAIAAHDAEEAAQAAQVAQTAAETAQGHAESAQRGAEAAQTAAETAQGKAEAAQTGAETAQGKAETAQGKAENAQTAAERAQGLAETAQGAAERAQTAAETAQGKAEDAQTGAETAQRLAEAAQTAAETAEAGAIAALQTVLDKAPIIIDSASGAIASISDGADDMPFKSVTAQIVPQQDLHGYDNPWSAGGGKNVFPPLTAETKNGVTLSIDSNGGITINTATGGATVDTYFDANVSLFIPAGTFYYLYAFNPDAGDSRLTLFMVGNAGNLQVNLNAENASYSQASTADNTVSKVRLRVPSGAELTNFTLKPYLQIGGTAPTAFSPYTNICPISGHTGVNVMHSGEETSEYNTYPVSWQTEAGTVYGGTIDIVSGLLTVDMAYDQMTYQYLSGLSSSYIGYGQQSIQGVVKNVVFVRNWNYQIAKVRQMGGIQALCNAFPIWFHDTSLYASQNRVYFDVGSMESLDDFLTAIQSLETGGSGLYIAFKLETPQTYQLTPTEVKTLLGINHVWADTGDTSIVYPADTKLYIDGKIASLQALILENG